MSCSKPEGTDEYWSSNESGWTAYIASPEHENNHDDDDDGDDRSTSNHRGHKHDAEDVESDDSMASDASSGPSNRPYGHANKHHGLVHAGNYKNERKHAGGKKEQQQEVKKKHDHEKKKAVKDKADTAVRSKKR